MKLPKTLSPPVFVSPSRHFSPFLVVLFALFLSFTLCLPGRAEEETPDWQELQPLLEDLTGEDLSEEDLSRFSLEDLTGLLGDIDLSSLLQEVGGDSSSSSSSSSSSGELGGALGTILQLLGGGSRKIKDCTIAPIPDQTYTGKALTPNPNIQYNGARLKKGTDYSVKYTSNTSVGTAKCTIVGKGSYEGQKTVSFRIVKKGTSTTSGKKGTDLTVKLSKTTYVYTGQAKKPTAKVTSSGKSVPSSGYTLSYKNNTKVGIATVTVKGTGDYKGLTGEATFKITLKKISLRSASSKTQGSITASWNPDTQADGYDLWVSTNQSFSKPTKQRIDGSGKGSFEFTGLTSGKKYYVRLRSVKEVESKEWVSQWSTVKEVTVK